VRHTAPAILRDVKALRRAPARAQVDPGVQILNRRDVIIGAGARVKPGVVLDASEGPIVIGSRATIMPNAVITGPAGIGPMTTIKCAARIYPGTSIGATCKIGGEVEASVIHDCTNKQHDGYLGHSVLGSWVNLGADTNTSDLKNTYGTIKVPLNGTLVESGEMFIGSMIGDHAKTGINVMLDTRVWCGCAAEVCAFLLLGRGRGPHHL
jgi:UDP-N-acetylglucosamine diphosphorylase/glucosamine-1-phosphate N-acetyltransferase